MTARGNMRNYLCGLDLPEVLVERFMRTDARQVEYIEEWLKEIYDEFAGSPCMVATMRTDVRLLGTSLTLKAGERVALTAATNIPNGAVSFFAVPMKGRTDWYGSGDDSVLLYYSDLKDLVEWTDDDAVDFCNGQECKCDICGYCGCEDEFDGPMCADCNNGEG